MSDFDPSHRNVKNAEPVEFVEVANKFAHRRDDPPPIVIFRDKTGYVQALDQTIFNRRFERL